MTDTFRREYKELTPEKVDQMNSVKSKGQELYDLIGVVESDGTATLEIAAAKQHLEECIMWAVKAITA